MKNLITLIAFLVISNTMLSQGFINMTVTGNWVKSLTESDIIGAGNDYKTSYESIDGQTLLTINPNNKNNMVHVYVTRSNDDWNDNLLLKVKRTSNGNNSTVNGSIMYQLITNASPLSGAMKLFTCYDNVTNMTLQYEITGISVLLPVKSYSTTITYTVMY
ncbi:MAG: hypothetical protein APF83_10340 [Lutibacter sp. BRH_c52]|nr:MAG: hypothetical protein APF83_10340 [Lutibacter sp. BRH_c52]HCE54016.1 hypothetical protein [Lutibacter sp.]